MRILALLVLLLEIISLIILIKELYHDCKNNRHALKKNVTNVSYYLRRTQHYLSKWKQNK